MTRKENENSRNSTNTHIALAMETILKFREKAGKTPEDVSFNFLKYTDSNFSKTNLSTGSFKQTNFEKTKFVETKLNYTTLRGANLSRADLQGALLTNADFSEVNLKDVKNLIQKQFNEITYEKGSPPVNIPEHLTLPEDRAYIWEDGKRRFVKSDKPWSEQFIEN